MLKWPKLWKGGKAQAEPARPKLGPRSEPALSKPLDLTDPATIASFDEIAKQLRQNAAACPVTSGGYLLLDPTEVKSAFSNKSLSNRPSRFSALAPKNKDKYVAASVAANIPPFLDAPEHVTVRRWLSKAFFNYFKEFTPNITAISESHLRQLKPGMSYLLIEDVARNYVVDVVAQFVGVELSAAQMKEYTSSLFRLFAPAKDAQTFETTNEGLKKARTMLTRALQERRTDGKACLLTRLDQGDCPLPQGDARDRMIADNALLVLADGVENVEAAIGQVIARWYTQVPRPADITPQFVREVIRVDTPGQTIARIASEPLEVGGETVHSGTPVFLSLASANAGNGTQEDFSFGIGRHKCIGEQLAIAMISTFCDGIIRFQPDLDVSELHYAPMFGHKWPRGMKIRTNA